LRPFFCGHGILPIGHRRAPANEGKIVIMKRKGSFFVYIVQCSRGTYYTGYTVDLENRLKKHNDGTGAKYLRGKGPVKLVYAREYKYYKNAVKAEIAIKKLTRKEKEDFVGACPLADNYKQPPNPAL